MSIMHVHWQRRHVSDPITDYAKTKMDENYQQARRYKVESADDGLAQVYIPEGRSHIVDLKERTCSCGEFQEFLIPCRHAVATCLWQVEDPYEYLHEWYSLEYYRLTYSRHMHPVREEDLVEMFEESGPPELQRQ